MPDAGATTVEDIARGLETYLRSRPFAADMIDGIAAWWLSEETRSASIEQVEMAVEQLCRKKLLRADRQSSGVVIYRAVAQDDQHREPSN